MLIAMHASALDGWGGQLFLGAVASLLASVVTWAYLELRNNRGGVLRALWCWLFLRSQAVRISVAVVLCMEREGKYALIRVPHRDSAGPIGGVYKAPRQEALDKIGFVHEPRSNPEDIDDLRGVLPANRLPAFIRWFKSSGEPPPRESCDRAGLRELLEELTSVGFPSEIIQEPVYFRRVRRVEEGPFKVEDKPYRRQYRLIDVFRIVENDNGSRILDEVFDRAALDNDEVVAVTASEIRGETKTAVTIAPHAEYLLGEKRSVVGTS